MNTGLTQGLLKANFKEFDIEKGGKKTGIYENTSENRKLGRVGQKYSKDNVEDDGKSKRYDAKTISEKMREDRLLKDGWADKVSEMDTVTEEQLEELLPDYISGSSIAALVNDEKHKGKIKVGGATSNEEGHLVNGKRDGKWIQRKDGKTIGVATFSNGKIQSGAYPKLKEEGYYASDKKAGSIVKNNGKIYEKQENGGWAEVDKRGKTKQWYLDEANKLSDKEHSDKEVGLE